MIKKFQNPGKEDSQVSTCMELLSMENAEKKRTTIEYPNGVEVSKEK